MMPDTPSHVTAVEEITRHDGASVKCSSPVVVVSSKYVPSALAVKVPVTESEPVIGAEQPGAPTGERSRLSLTAKHEDATRQVPVTSPPQADTLVQTEPALPPAELPPVCGEAALS